jgi:hypothetical protein
MQRDVAIGPVTVRAIDATRTGLVAATEELKKRWKKRPPFGPSIEKFALLRYEVAGRHLEYRRKEKKTKRREGADPS